MSTTIEHTVEIQKTLDFLQEIGIRVVEKEIAEGSFLPGLELGSNCLYIDFNTLKYPGDILHEAGHLAVTSSENRQAIGTDKIPQNWPDGGEEMGAILWSYAALVHLELPVEFVFHPNGYKNNSEWMIHQFEAKNFIGLPFLEWIGLTLSPENAYKNNTLPFPAMLKWLRD